MKINFEIECTPIEARALMGLPDVSPLHQTYIDTLRDTMKNGISPDLAENVIRSWSSTGEAGLQIWRRMLESGGKGS